MSDSSGNSCPICGGPLETEPTLACAACSTPHHVDCWMYLRQCSTYGCGSTRAADESRVDERVRDLVIVGAKNAVPAKVVENTRWLEKRWRPEDMGESRFALRRAWYPGTKEFLGVGLVMFLGMKAGLSILTVPAAFALIGMMLCADLIRDDLRFEGTQRQITARRSTGNVHTVADYDDVFAVGVDAEGEGWVPTLILRSGAKVPVGPAAPWDDGFHLANANAGLLAQQLGTRFLPAKDGTGLKVVKRPGETPFVSYVRLGSGDVAASWE